MDSDSSSATGTNKYVPEYRRTNFKNKNKFSAEELRKRRENQQVELRKNKREEVLAKRRNMAALTESSNDGATNDFLHSADNDGLQDILPGIIQKMLSNDLSEQLNGSIALRQLLSKEDNPPIRQVLDSGILPRLIEFIGVNQPDQLQHEASWAITNLCSGSSEDTARVVNANILPPMVQLIDSNNIDVKEQAIWCISNIAGDSPEHRDMCVKIGVIAKLLDCFELNKTSLTKTCIWTLSNMCRGKSARHNWPIISSALPAISKLIYSMDVDILGDALWTLSYISDGDDTVIETVLKYNVASRLVQLLNHSFTQVQTPALRTVGNLLTGSDMFTQTLLAARVLEPLANLLSSQKEHLRKEACWCFSNILAGTLQQAKEVISIGIVPKLLEIIETDTDRVKKEALWCICNACAAGNLDPEIIRYLVANGVIKTFCEQLTSMDVKNILLVLDSIEQILKIGEADKEAHQLVLNEYASLFEQFGGADTIFNLQSHESSEVYQKAFNIVDKYFSDEDEAEALLNDENGNIPNQFSYSANNINTQNFQF